MLSHVGLVPMSFGVHVFVGKSFEVRVRVCMCSKVRTSVPKSLGYTRVRVCRC